MSSSRGRYSTPNPSTVCSRHDDLVTGVARLEGMQEAQGKKVENLEHKLDGLEERFSERLEYTAVKITDGLKNMHDSLLGQIKETNHKANGIADDLEEKTGEFPIVKTDFEKFKKEMDDKLSRCLSTDTIARSWRFWLAFFGALLWVFLSGAPNVGETMGRILELLGK